MHGRNNGNPVFLFVAPVTPFMIQNTNMASSSQGISSQLMRPLKSTPAGFDQIFKTTIENSGMAEFSTFQGLFQISTLNHHGVAGAITRRTIRSDGTVLSEIVTRTPGSLSLEKAYSTIVKTDNDENLRLVLNKAAQESYSALVDVIDIQLPAVLDRKRRTIPVYTGSGEHAVVAAHGKRRLESCVDVDAGGGGGGDGALLKRPRAV